MTFLIKRIVVYVQCIYKREREGGKSDVNIM